MLRPLPIILVLSLVAVLGLVGYISRVNGFPICNDHHNEEQAPSPANEMDQRQENQRGPVEDQPSRVSAAQPSKPAPDQQTGEDMDRTVMAWFFARNQEHRPPTTDPDFLKAIAGGRGIFLGPTDRPTVYLTFDEGYENGYTPRILDVLADNGVSAAFFVTGPYVRHNPDLVRRMAAEGHVIGNHTQNHPSLPGISNSLIREEVLSVHQQVLSLTGKQMHFFRPPMGEFNRRTLDQVYSLGYTSVFWSMAYKDWDIKNQPGKEAAYRHVIDNIHPGAVILLHAVSQSNTEALGDILKELKRRGYRFGSLDELT